MKPTRLEEVVLVACIPAVMTGVLKDMPVNAGVTQSIIWHCVFLWRGGV